MNVLSVSSVPSSRSRGLFGSLPRKCLLRHGRAGELRIIILLLVSTPRIGIIYAQETKVITTVVEFSSAGINRAFVRSSFKDDIFVYYETTTTTSKLCYVGILYIFWTSGVKARPTELLLPKSKLVKMISTSSERANITTLLLGFDKMRQTSPMLRTSTT